MRILTIVLSLLISTIVKAQNWPYTIQTEVGMLAGEGVNPSFTAQIFNGVKIDKWKLEVGLTSGVDIYRQITVLPLSAGLKWNPLNTRPVSPFISLNAGYGFDWLQRRVENQKYDGGYMFNPSLGLRIKTKNRAKVNLSIGYRQQKAVIYQPFYPILYDFIFVGQDIQVKDELKFRRLSLSFGLSF